METSFKEIKSGIPKVREYIKKGWERTLKANDANGFWMPHDYVAPCVSGTLTDLYYWDTYFTNKGLYLDKLANLAYNNIENLKYCLRLFKCVPNMCRENGADYASQPPLLFLMVKDHFAQTKNLDFLSDSYEALKLEYTFWMTERMSETGLNKYGTNVKSAFTEERINKSLNALSKRINLDTSGWTSEGKYDFFIGRIGEGESGEDHTPRFNNQSANINPVDLNSHLYGFEQTMAEFSDILSKDESALWKERAKKRKKLIDELCLDKKSGIYFDYNFIKKETTGVYCVANYLPFFHKLTDDINALEKINGKLIEKNGVLSCEYIETTADFQWGYPNSWAPHNYFAFMACYIGGLKGAARSIAETFVVNVTKEFNFSNRLWEKYDGVEGGKAKVDEYGTPEMLGWTAGVYNVFTQFLNNESVI